MSLIDGIGDEVIYFFLSIFVIIVVIFSWFTTNISEHRYIHTAVLLVDGRRNHRLSQLTRLTNHTQALTVSEGTASSNEESTSTAATVTETNKPELMNPDNRTTSEDESEQATIVSAMDDDTFVVRQRRLAFYEKSSNEEPNDNSEIQSSSSQSSSGTACPLLVKKNENLTETEKCTVERRVEEISSSSSSGITIKLKYINDDLRLVDGNLQEKLGDFKRRHFNTEISSNKLVKLIFNGHVLHQDNRTLQNCGLFHNCVVHCLIHQKRPVSGEQNAQNIDGTDNISQWPNGLNNNNNNNQNQGRDWDFSNFLFALISFTLLSAWYFRFVYPHLYTVLATGGLILITGIFSFVLFGIYFPQQDNNLQNQRTDDT